MQIDHGITLGMSVSGARQVVSWIMAVLCPLSLVAADGPSAMVHSSGGVWVNGAEVADSTTVFGGDSLETKPGFVANLDTPGSSVLIQPESLVKFQGNFMVLEHGGVSVGTSTEMAVHVNCIRVEPVSNQRTQYDVTDLSGKVEVSADKNDVTIREESGRSKTDPKHDSGQSNVVHEGHRENRYETTACGAAPQPQGPASALNTKWLEIGGVAGGAGLLCILLCKPKSPNSVSPSDP
jgi:hypothetical protein